MVSCRKQWWCYSLIVIMLLQGCAGWSKGDKLKFTSFVAFQAIDGAQSVKFIDEDREANSLYTNNGSLIVGKIVAVGAIYLLSEYLPESRSAILNVANVVSGGVVIWNFTQYGK